MYLYRKKQIYFSTALFTFMNTLYILKPYTRWLIHKIGNYGFARRGRKTCQIYGGINKEFIGITVTERKEDRPPFDSKVVDPFYSRSPKCCSKSQRSKLRQIHALVRMLNLGDTSISHPHTHHQKMISKHHSSHWASGTQNSFSFHSILKQDLS